MLGIHDATQYDQCLTDIEMQDVLMIELIIELSYMDVATRISKSGNYITKIHLYLGGFFIYMVLLYELNYLSEHIRVGDSEVRENLTVESYTLQVHRVYECRVSHTVETCSIVHAHCPETAELTLLELASDICILSCLHDSSLSTRIYVSIHTAETLCKSEDTLMSFVCHHTTFYTSHR